MRLVLRKKPRFKVALLAASMTLLAACANDPNFSRMTEPVSTISVGEPGEISAMSLVQAMSRVGFTREEILDLGPGIRRSLNQTGGAQARRGQTLVALFSLRDGMLYVTSANSGTFTLRAT